MESRSRSRVKEPLPEQVNSPVDFLGGIPTKNKARSVAERPSRGSGMLDIMSTNSGALEMQ